MWQREERGRQGRPGAGLAAEKLDTRIISLPASTSRRGAADNSPARLISVRLVRVSRLPSSTRLMSLSMTRSVSRLGRGRSHAPDTAWR